MSDQVTVVAPVVTSNLNTDQCTHDINKPIMVNEANFKSQELNISMESTQVEDGATVVTISYT